MRLLPLALALGDEGLGWARGMEEMQVKWTGRLGGRFEGSVSGSIQTTGGFLEFLERSGEPPWIWRQPRRVASRERKELA